MVQTSFDFPKFADHTAENFISLDENLEAQKILSEFFSQKLFSNSKLQSLILKGEKACGKTHLLNIFAHKSAAKFLTKDDLSQDNLMRIFSKNHFYIFDDIDYIDDEMLLNLVNLAAEREVFLLMSLENMKVFKLKDLVSRLRNIFVVEIKNLEESSIKQLVVNGFSRRQIKLSAHIINFICDNISRNYLAVSEALNKVEELCYLQKGEVSLRDLKELF